MSTTTIRMTDELKKRVTRAAKHAGTTPHAFILDAIAEHTDAQEQRTDFESVAEARFADIASTGKTVTWHALRGYLEKRATGHHPRRPTARNLAAHKR
jgi:predicted transcriptional regulator